MTVEFSVPEGLRVQDVSGRKAIDLLPSNAIAVGVIHVLVKQYSAEHNWWESLATISGLSRAVGEGASVHIQLVAHEDVSVESLYLEFSEQVMSEKVPGLTMIGR